MSDEVVCGCCVVSLDASPTTRMTQDDPFDYFRSNDLGSCRAPITPGILGLSNNSLPTVFGYFSRVSVEHQSRVLVARMRLL